MEKREIIERTKKAFLLYKENKIYQALKEIYPVAQKVKTDKVQKLYKVLILKAKQLLEDLLKVKEYNKLEEIEYMFFEGIDLPQIKSIFSKGKEERQKLIQEAEEKQREKKEEEKKEKETSDKEETGKEKNNEEHVKPEETEEKQEEEPFSFFENEEEQTFSKNESESFEFDAENFKLSSFSEDEMGEQDVNALIQKGVSLYEVGDIENALIVWKQAKQLQPDNEFLQEYISNAENELGYQNEEQNQEIEENETFSETQHQEEIEEEIIFNEDELSGELKRVIATARSGDIERAKNILKSLLENNQINDKQYSLTLKYISKLDKEVGLSIIKNKIKNFVEDKEFDKALEYLEKYGDKLKFDEKNRIEQYVVQKKQEFELSQSFELELEEEPEKKTRPKRDFSKKREKRVTLPQKKKNRFNFGQFFKTTFFFLLLLAILGIVVYYGISIIKKNVQTNDNNFDFQTFQVNQKQKEKEQLFKKFINEAKDYFDMGEYLFAYYTFLHAERYGKLDEGQVSFLSKARKLMKQEAINKRKELRLAERYFKRGEYEKAIPHYKKLLSENPEDLRLKDKLFTCYKKTAIKYALNNEILKAKKYFTYALVLNRSDTDIPKHIKVLDRYLKGKINQRLLTQWFYFFIK